MPLSNSDYSKLSVLLETCFNNASDTKEDVRKQVLARLELFKPHGYVSPREQIIFALHDYVNNYDDSQLLRYGCDPTLRYDEPPIVEYLFFQRRLSGTAYFARNTQTLRLMLETMPDILEPVNIGIKGRKQAYIIKLSVHIGLGA